MVQTLPLSLPASLVDTHAIDLNGTYTTGWWMAADDVATAPCGDTYALYGAYRHTYGVDRAEPDPARQNFSYRILTRYAPDGTPLATAVFRRPGSGESPSALAHGGEFALCPLPDGTLAVSAQADRTHLLAPDLSTVLGHFTGRGREVSEEPGAGEAGGPFVTSMSLTPAGRAVCVTTEYGVHRYGSRIPNIVALADTLPTPDAKPALRAIASLDPEPAHQSEADLSPYVRYRDEPVGLGNRPSPALTELLTPGSERSYAYDGSHLGRPAVLGEDRFVVPVFSRTYRGGSRGRPFSFVLLNGQGEMTGSLGGMQPWRDSPFTGFCWRVVADPRRGHAFHLNRYGLYAWGPEGQLRAKLSTESKAFKALTRFTLMEASPTGDLVLVHGKQQLVLRVPAPDDLGELGAVVEEALRTYGKQRTALKKRWEPVNWHWADDGSVPVHHL
ncbi:MULTISPECIES: hypothetical protein [unclassified Streptomyces]|uniref:hypothetical protein n=1 Tax=unclassified Streptomyces TaxID=2593676 RepID=UPI002259D2ED|nr:MULTISPECIES: hypothetical protein [unclassified Streptomyces]MCX4525996.1 hypothetical protein [Streptomyces sp. NBC_01551]MCX4543441.1 hypothetical protein [Streptomyces sp. NBC_01565]